MGLLQMYQDRQKESAVASGKDYCKNGGQHTLRAGGVLLVAGVKRKELEQEEDLEVEEERAREKRRETAVDMEAQRKRAAIEAKYCGNASSRARDGSNDSERLRLG